MIGSATKSRKFTLSPSSAHVATISSEPDAVAASTATARRFAADEQQTITTSSAARDRR